MRLPDGRTFHFGGKPVSIKAEITVRTSDFFRKCVLFGDIGFGEAYSDGDWDTPSIADVISFMIHNVETHPAISGNQMRAVVTRFFHLTNNAFHRVRANDLTGSRKNISEHYDLSNDFFKLFLDRQMVYSSAYFSQANFSLEAAQVKKIDRLCSKLRLGPENHLLEIGSGWGALASHAARKYGCRVTTVTISKEQYKYAAARFRKEGLRDRVKILLCDYRELTGSFDRIVSCEMLEAVGHRYLPDFFRKCHSLLEAKGIMAHQVILSPDSRYESFRRGKDWIQKHIFPGSLLPSVSSLLRAIRRTGDVDLWDFEEMGLDYARTLRTWRQRFNARQAEVRGLGFTESFIRKWNYYFAYCEAAFSTRNITVAQMVFSRPNNESLRGRVDP